MLSLILNFVFKFNSLDLMSFSLQGPFEIISLKAATLQSDNNRMAALSVSLAGPDGRVLGGEVVGALTAATAVQVLLSNGIKFMSNCKQLTYIWNFFPCLYRVHCVCVPKFLGIEESFSAWRNDLTPIIISVT